MTLQQAISKKKQLNLTRVKVKLPKDILKSMQNYNKNARSTMWVAGFYMGAFMLSKDSPDEQTRILCPMPESKKPSFLLNCEVVKILK